VTYTWVRLGRTRNGTAKDSSGRRNGSNREGLTKNHSCFADLYIYRWGINGKKSKTTIRKNGQTVPGSMGAHETGTCKTDRTAKERTGGT
jgi:hypothetical protein